MAFSQSLAQNGTFRRPGRARAAFPQAAAQEDISIAAKQGSANGFRKAGC
jgi:hypothetical protein